MTLQKEEVWQHEVVNKQHTFCQPDVKWSVSECECVSECQCVWVSMCLSVSVSECECVWVGVFHVEIKCFLWEGLGLGFCEAQMQAFSYK